MRKIGVILEVLQVSAQQLPHLVRHGRLLYISDSRCAVYALSRMSGNDNIFPRGAQSLVAGLGA